MASTYRTNQYRMNSAGFDRKNACRGHFNTPTDEELGIVEVDSDDGCDYVDWDARAANNWRRDINYTYRVINGEIVHFANGERY